MDLNELDEYRVVANPHEDFHVIHLTCNKVVLITQNVSVFELIRICTEHEHA